ncbi:sulfatase [Sphingobacterium sp. JB170]|uniref:sulfatase family protein n=1 Tax=Sphingobacterium sp. JB170 TaxID=1434842 RepID=UPI00097EC2A9|nr:sulfatase [Sphingobacterium sp. JB170]SJN47556.1 Choline-sulfatase [Sphingobacterium sp. JB170]
MLKKYIILYLALLSVNYSLLAQKRPNVVIIVSDDHAYQTIGAYGSKYAKTPNIDRIANEGALFSHAYVNNSICGPSRATLLTGKYSHKNGFRDNETSEFDFSQDSFVKQLQSAGYNTAWVGKIHLGEKLQGFNYFDVLVGQGTYFNPVFSRKEGRELTEGYVSSIITDKALGWLDQQESTEPFCLVLGHKATHRTWMPDPQDFGKFDSVDFEIPATFYDDYASRDAAKQQEMSIDKDMLMGYDLKMFPTLEAMMADGNFKRMNPEQRDKYIAYYRPIYQELESKKLTGKALAEWKFKRYMIDYLNTAESMDRNIGRVLDYLEEKNLTDNTIVIYLSDQGFYMGEHGWFDKRWMYEESFRTPFLMKYPGKIKPHSTLSAKVVNADIAPTLLELASVKVPVDMQGKSFVHVLNKPNSEHRKNLFYHYFENGEHAVSPHFGVADDRYKLIRYYKRVENWELFDMKQDPREMHNVYSDPSYKNIVKKMKKKLLNEIESFDDQEAKAIFLTDIEN